MSKEIVILFAEDNHGHFILTENYFARMGVRNRMVWLRDGRETLNYLFNEDQTAKPHENIEYVLFLDIRMPKIDGIEVMKRIKENEQLKNINIIMLTTTDNHTEIEHCYEMGCSAYIVKPVKYSSYIDAMRKVGLFPSIIANGVELKSKCPT